MTGLSLALTVPDGMARQIADMSSRLVTLSQLTSGWEMASVITHALEASTFAAVDAGLVDTMKRIAVPMIDMQDSLARTWLPFVEPQQRLAESFSRLALQMDTLVSSRLVDALLPTRRAFENLQEISKRLDGVGLALEHATKSMTAFETFGAMLADLAEPTMPFAELALTQLDVGNVILSNAFDSIRPLTQFGQLTASSLGLELLEPNIYQALTRKLSQGLATADLDTDLAESEPRHSAPARISSSMATIVEVRLSVNRRSQLLGRPAIFKATADTEYAAATLIQWLVSNEDDFRKFIDLMFKYVYESSAELDRLPQSMIDSHPVGLQIKFLRHYYYHDHDHGAESKVTKKYANVGEVFRNLIGKPFVTRPDEWSHLQLAILSRVRDLMEALNSQLSDEAAS
jgi:hypothetical protein